MLSSILKTPATIRVFLTAAGISITIALIDITYRAIKRSVEKKRLERENTFTEEPIQFLPTTLPIEDEPAPPDRKPTESVSDAVSQKLLPAEQDSRTDPPTSAGQIPAVQKDAA